MEISSLSHLSISIYIQIYITKSHHHPPNHHTHTARRWVHLRIYEVRAMRRRRSVFMIQRVYRGYLGRQVFHFKFITLTSAALFIQRAYKQ